MKRQTFEDKVPHFGPQVYVADTALVIGDVHLDEDVSVWPQAVLRGDIHHIHVGRASNIQDACVLHVTHDSPYSPGGFALRIGQQVTVGHRAVLHGCTVGDRCLIGIGAIVMDGAVLEDEVILGAGALVPPGKRLTSGQVYVGSPARPQRPLNDQERQFLRYSADHYVELKNHYLGI